MSQQELLKKVIQALTDAKVEYLITGSTVSSLQGEPRSTHDIDLVVALKEQSAKALVKIFRPPRFYLDEQSIVEAIQKQDMFNLVDTKEGGKVDFWMLTDDPFDQSRFSRRQRENILGIKMYVSSPEDTILVKLKWAKMSGGSEKQFRDALRVFEVQSKKLDIKYLEDWVKKLSLEPYWKRLKEEAQAI